MRVPLVVRDPRLAPARRGVTRGEFALNLDVAPTLVAAAGLAVPAVMQGRDLSPLYLSPRAPDWRDEFFYEHPTVTSRNRIPTSEAVVRRDWKYVEWPEFAFRQLFDLHNDPGELRNLAGQPAHASRELELRQRLEAWRRRAR
jgi:arylsulfatase A-like enzyme